LGLSSIAQGDGESNRDGRRCTVKSVAIRGVICEAALEDANLLVANEYFIALVQDTQTNGAQLNSEDVYKNIMGGSIGGTSMLRELQFQTRFKVLATRHLTRPVRTITTDTSGNTSFEAVGTCVKFSMYKKLNMPITFKGTTGIIANVVDNSLHIIAVCLNSANVAPLISYSSRVRFMG